MDRGVTRLLAVLLPAVPCLAGREAPPADEAAVLVNHVGFAPAAAKFCLTRGSQTAAFQVVTADGDEAVFEGRMTPAGGDFEGYLAGEFSALQRPGVYRVRCGQRVSEPLRIAPDVYEDAIRKAVRYFSVQRCGPSTTGFHAPCHLDDGRRADNGTHQDVTGGWHDACDLRRWVTATIYGMIGLVQVAEARREVVDRETLVEELRWGNRYFLAMQEPAGYLMSFCGGDFRRHGDDNRWTDNIPGNDDDRWIKVEPVEAVAQYGFILSQAVIIDLTRPTDPAYARRCDQAARRCLDWCLRENAAVTTTELGAAAAACARMYRTCREPRLAELACDFGRRVMANQATEQPDPQTPIRGFFRVSTNDARPLAEPFRGPWGLLGLCSLVETFPDHPEAGRWRKAIGMYCGEYLLPMGRLNAFGLVPFSLYAGDGPGRRRVGSLGYRWFLEPGPEWWVGINANVASAGVGLVRASRLLGEPAWRALAQRQLDWILGVNPFDASTMEDVGRNQPRQFRTDEFDPVTPRIPGAVMNGIGGTADDRPLLIPGWWQTCEYWTPMVCYTMWLMAELQAGPGP